MKSNRIIAYIRKRQKLILLSLCVMLFSFGIYLFQTGGKFVLGYDMQYQHLFFYAEMKRLVFSGQLPFWSRNLFLGADFFASKAYYCIGDPFAWLVILFPLKYLPYGMMFSYLLKYLTAVLLFDHLLELFGLSEKGRVFGALTYGFCGWAAMFAEHPMFLVWHTFLPLLLIGVEKVFRENRYSIFILAVFLIILSNYYFFYTTSLFLALYWIMRYLQLRDFRFKAFVVDTLKLIGTYCIGVLMSLVLIFPAVKYLLESARLGSELIITHKWNPIQIYLDMVIKTLIPPFQVNELGHMLFNTTDYNTNQLSLYSSVFCILLLPQICLRLKEKKYRGYFAMLLLLFVFMLFPIFSSILHGFNTPNFRWTLLFITMIVITASELWDKGEYNRILLLATAVFLCLLIGGIILYAKHFYIVLWDHILPEARGLALAGALILLYLVLLLWKKETLIYALLCLELIYSTCTTFDRFPAVDFHGFDFNNTLSLEAVQFIKNRESENSFYRIYVPYHDANFVMPHNINLYYDYMGAYTYDSLLEPSSYEFAVDTLGYSAAIRQPAIQDMNVLKNLCFRYIIARKDTQDFAQQPDNYQLLRETDDGYCIYEILDAKDFPIDLTLFKDNLMKGKIHAEKNQTLVIPLAYDAGWTILVDGKKTEVLDSHHFLSVSIEAGEHLIEMRYLPPGIKLGCAGSIIGFGIYLLILLMKKTGTQQL